MAIMSLNHILPNVEDVRQVGNSQSILERTKRFSEEFSRTDINLGDSWGSALLDNLQLMSDMAGEILPPVSQQFLGSPDTTLAQLLDNKVRDMVEEDEMLESVISVEKAKQLK